MVTHMNEEDIILHFAWLGEEYYQEAGQMYKKQEREKKDGPIPIGKIFIHQMKMTRDVKDRYEPLYSIKYDDLIFNETKTIENKTFDELVNFIDKQKLIYEKKEIIEQILLYNVIYNHCNINGREFILKEVVDFKKENLPQNPI